MLEKKQYYAARTKCVANPQKCINIIMDAMDQRKTRVPFFTNPAKMVANELPLKLKLFGATVHGHGTYFFYCTEQVKHDSDLSIEVGHTHEDIDQKFIRIGRYIRKVLQEVLSIPAFVVASYDTFTTRKGGQPPKCVEPVTYCYNTLPLARFLDNDLARFALPEKTGDNVHYFLMRRNATGRAVMQYKFKRYSDALWPRKYNPGQQFLPDQRKVLALYCAI